MSICNFTCKHGPPVQVVSFETMRSWTTLSLGQTRPGERHHLLPPRFSLRKPAAAQICRSGVENGENGGVQAVLFDMDGVLCDSEGLSARVGVKCFKDVYDLDVTKGDFAPFSGMGEVKYLSGVADKYGAKIDIEECKKAFYEIFTSQCAAPGADIGFPGALDLIKACKTAGLKIALASSADRVKMEASLVAAGIPIEIFDTTVTASDGITSLKPSPQIFLEAAKRLQIDPQNCVVIEDSRAGIQAAETAGMACVAVATTLTANVLADLSADAVFSDIASIAVEDLSKTHGESSKENSSEPGWLEKQMDLPGGYKTTRRDALKLINAAVVIGSGYILVSRGKAMSFTSPKAIKKLFNPSPKQMDDGNRVEAFRRYISDLEKKGGGEIVPEFPLGVDWLNSAPLKWKRELKGKIVVLDFWTYCCINCMHVLPDLASIEQTFQGQPVAVVGVHSAKFDNEKDSEAIRSAVIRYDVTHPVLNDGNMAMWKGLGVSSWPTLAVVGPRGNLLFMLTGEHHLQDLRDLITAALEFYGKRQELDNTPIPQELERDKDLKQLQSPLRFPGKIATDLEGDRLFISDSNNHRLVVTTLGGKFISHIGGNGTGFVDGSFDDCAFNRPQGIAYDGRRGVLYVADTENHALREVNLKSGMVKTLAGNGYQGLDYKGGQKGTNQQLSSPWDVVLDAEGKLLYIAMAGQHQIWRHNVDNGITSVFSGNGYERNKNGGNGTDTSWAQPSGLSLSKDGSHLFVADSESSSIRQLDLGSGGSRACVGGDYLFADNLFRFGDKDGEGGTALLQHPLGVCQGDDGKVYVADSYNHRIKVLDPVLNSITTLAGAGVAGYADGAGSRAKLSEPGGLARGPNGSIIVADTNNNLIRVIDDGKVTTRELTGVPPPRLSPLTSLSGGESTSAPGKVITADALTTQSGELDILVNFPRGFNYTKGANSVFTARAVGPSSSSIQIVPSSGSLSESGAGSTKVAFTAQGPIEGVNKIQIDTKLYYCEEGEACLFEELRIEAAFAADLGSGTSINKVEVKPSKTAPMLESLI